MNAPFQGKSIPAYLNDSSCSLIFSVYFDDFKTIDTSKNYRCVEFWNSFLPFSCTCLEKLNRSWLLHFIQTSYVRKATLKLLPQSDGEKKGSITTEAQKLRRSNRFPIGKLATRRKELQEIYLENCQSLKEEKRKVDRVV